MHALGDDVTLPSFTAPPQPLSTENRSFWFLDNKQTTSLFFLFLFYISIDVEKGHHSSLKLCSSNVKYFCFVVVRQLFLFIRIFLVVIHL